ncbi:hypothetical protein HDE_03995 [Halotydeus destructor]|nr:hypothetical protein HDE_03995 [Halotydeus destructor]
MNTLKSAIFHTGDDTKMLTTYSVCRHVAKAAFSTMATVSFNTTAIMLYHAAISAVVLAQRDFLSYEVYSATCPDKLQVQLKTLNVLKTRLDQVLSITPFAWFSFCFTIVLSSSVQMMKQSHSIWQMGFLDLYQVAFNCIAVLSIVLHIDYADRKTKALVLNLIESFNDRKNQPRMKSILSETQRTYELNFTAWSLFKITRADILTFASCVVTFTVLAVQLAD